MEDIDYMRIALKEAEMSLLSDDVPVGCVIVKDDKIISSAHNCREKDGSAVNHAEIIAISKACESLGSWRLHGCTMYVTLEPCPMCAGAVLNSRIPKVVYGLKNPKTGAMGSVVDLNSYPLNHKTKVVSGCCVDECREIIQRFFKNKK